MGDDKEKEKWRKEEDRKEKRRMKISLFTTATLFLEEWVKRKIGKLKGKIKRKKAVEGRRMAKNKKKIKR